MSETKSLPVLLRLTVLSSALILAGVLGLSGCQRNLTDKDFVERGKEAQEHGKLAEAEIELKNALQKNPDNPEARRRLGEVYVGQGKGKAGEEQLLRAKALGGNASLLAAPLGEAYLLQGQFAEVLNAVQPGSDASPQGVARILEIRGRASIGLNDAAGGCRMFAQAIESDPKYAPAYRAVSRCEVSHGEIDKARATLDKAFALDPKDSASWVALGDLEQSAKRPAEAEAAYARALAERSDNVSALLDRATLRIEMNKLDAANQDAQAALNLAQGLPLPHQLRGVILYKQGKYAEAQTSFESALRIDPEYLPAVVWVGLANYAQSNYEQAAARFAQFVKRLPAVRVQALLGLTQAKMGLKGDAGTTLASFRNVNVDDPQSLALLAQAHMTIGEVAPAENYLKQAVAQQPDSAKLRVGLAATMSQKGQRTEAIEQLQDAIRIDPHVGNAEVLLIQNLIKDKQLDKALAEADAFVKKDPKNPTAFNMKGAVYLAKNDNRAARENFERAAALKPDSAATAMNLAQLDMLEKNPDAARRRFEQVLATDKKNVEAMVGLARIAAATGHPDEYLSWLERATQADAKAVLPRILLISQYLQQRDVKRALALAQQTQAIAPENGQVLDALGTAQINAGEKENALMTYRKWVSVDPKNPVAHYKLGAVHAAMQNLQSAQSSVNRALTLRPDYEEAEVLQGFTELSAHRFAEAAKLGQQLQRKYPKSPSGFMLEGDALMADKKFAQAQAPYQSALALGDNDLLAIRVHQAKTAVGNANDADADLLRWLNAKPNDTVARSYLASSFARAGKIPQAVEQYQKLIEVQPRNVPMLNELALAYQKMGDSRALATAEQARQLDPERAEIMDTAGWILVDQGQTARGLELLQTAAAKAPNTPAIRYHLAVGLSKNGDKPRARRELETLLQSQKSFPERADAERLLKTLQ